MTKPGRPEHGVQAMPAIDRVAIEARPFWSVMVPCYNSAALLAAALESVLAQDPGRECMQIEVVDDGSTLDDPAEVVRRVGGDRVGFFRQPHNVGASANFTTCVRRSVGHWVHILHSDDLVRPGFYERYGARIVACPDVLMVGARTVAVDDEARELGLTEPVATGGGLLLDAAVTVATTNPLRCVSVVVARAAYEQAGGFHPGLRHACDWEMWSRVAGMGSVGWVDEVLGCYRVHADSDTNVQHRSVDYLDDCLDATVAIAGRFPGSAHDVVLRGARKVVCEYALTVGTAMLERGEWRLAVANAVRAVRIDPSPDVRSRASRILFRAVRGRLRG